MHEPLTDAELEALIRTHTPRLWTVVRAFAADDADAEDLLQSVWIIAAERAHERANSAPLGAWLHIVALNRGRAHHRRMRRRVWLRRLWRADLPEVADATRSPQIAAALRSHALWRAVAELPPLQREVLLLRIVHGYSTQESAQRINRAEGTVKASLHRALAALRTRLADSGPEVVSQDAM
jgi:RNA polymerase sigma-70 factor, ECF subfamily